VTHESSAGGRSGAPRCPRRAFPATRRRYVVRSFPVAVAFRLSLQAFAEVWRYLTTTLARPLCAWAVQTHKQDRANKFTISRHVSARGGFLFHALPFFKLAPVRFDYVASRIVNANHSLCERLRCLAYPAIKIKQSPYSESNPVDSPHNAVKSGNRGMGGGNNHSTPHLSVPFPLVPRKRLPGRRQKPHASASLPGISHPLHPFHLLLLRLCFGGGAQIERMQRQIRTLPKNLIAQSSCETSV
jgi:hypothetical protein